MKKTILLLACILIFTGIQAQFVSNVPATGDATNAVTYLKWTTADGLPSNTINDLLFDASGLLWIATNSGVSTFNGTTFTNYTTANGLASNTVSRLYKDHLNRIWAEGANTFSFYNGTWQPHPINSQLIGLGDNMNGGLFQDNSHNFYFSSHNPGSIYTFDETHLEVYIPRANYSTYSAKFDINNNLWILAYDTISKYVSKVRVNKTYLNSYGCGGYNKIVTDKNNMLWVLQCNGLYKSLDFDTFSFLGSTWNYYWDVAFDSQNNAVFGRYAKASGGIKILRGSTWSEFSTPQGFISTTVNAVEISSIDKIWAGADDGLYQINEVITSNENLHTNTNFISPNPVKENFTVDFRGNDLSLTITDINGRLLMNRNKLTSGELVDVSSFNTGLYFVRITDKNGVSKVGKFVKN